MVDSELSRSLRHYGETAIYMERLAGDIEKPRRPGEETSPVYLATKKPTSHSDLKLSSKS